MATIEIQSGSNAGTSADVNADVVLGRSPSSTLCLPDNRASRAHALVRKEMDDSYTILDMNSGNGTYLNGKRMPPDTPLPIQDGDTVVIGNTKLLFRNEGGPSRKRAASQADLVADDAALAAVMRVNDKGGQSINQTLDASMDILQARAEENEAVTIERLQAMVKVANELGHAGSQEELLGLILDKIFDIFPAADRGFIMLRDSEDGEMNPAVGRNRQQLQQDAEFAVSRTIINAVVEQRQSVLSMDAAEDFGAQQSIVDLAIRSLMCAPLICNEEILGVISVDTKQSGETFTDNDLAMLTGIASQAATALKNLVLFKEIQNQVKKTSELSRYMSPDVAQAVADGSLSAELGGKRARGTIFFCDIVGFTAISETMNPVELMESLNAYFQVTTDIVARNRGTINKFGGDMILAFWNVMFPDETPERNAIITSLQMQTAVWCFDLDLKAKEQHCIYLGIGLNTGDFAAGNLGGERIEYTVIGDNVNLAQRIESLAGRWQVFASATTVGPVLADCIAIALPPVTVKGKSEPIQLYSVRGIRLSAEETLLTVPAQLQRADGGAIGEGLITFCRKSPGSMDLEVATEETVPANQEVVLQLDLPEYDTPLALRGTVCDDSRDAHRGDAVYSLLSVCDIQGDEASLGFLQPGAPRTTGRNWDEMKRR